MMQIAIVGAGPAGASAGYHLAKRGHAVTLIDQAAFPRNKTCGDWIPLAALRELERMDLDRAMLERLAPERVPITATLLASPDGRTTASATREPACCIPRRVFDDILWRHALAAGCRPERRVVRDLSRTRDGFLARFDHVVDARGANAGTANAIALRGYWTVRRSDLDSHAAALVQIHTDASFRRGYGWIFPVHVSADTVRFNVGVGLWKDDSRIGRNIADFFARFVARNGAARTLHEHATEIERPVGYHVALGAWRNRVAEDGVLRVGDAANLADPLTGDGIGNALKSGFLVAEAIDSSADGAGAARLWQRLHDETFAPELRTALVLRQALASGVAKNLTARALGRSPILRSRVHAAFFGETPYRSLFAARADDPAPATRVLS